MIGDAQNRVKDEAAGFGGMDTVFPHPTEYTPPEKREKPEPSGDEA